MTRSTLLFLFVALVPSVTRAELKAGAAAVDVSPAQLPVFVNGGMTSRTANQITTRLYARAIVLDDGHERIAMVVVDSCMMPRPLLDEAKQLASRRTKLKPDRIMISATHTHTAPASMGALGTDADPTYVPYLREKLAEAIAAAEANLEPARVGFAVRDAADYTALRRWVRRPDRIAKDPFGNQTVRANMHAGSNWDDVTGESGPEDPALSLIAIQSTSGRPIAVLANFSMHYFSGQRGLSADYFGLFCKGLEQHLGGGEGNRPPPVAIMSHGCSGDIWRRDYRIPADKWQNPTIENFTQGMLKIAEAAYDSVQYQEDADLAMAEQRMTLNYRAPDEQRLEWARRVVEEMGDRLPKTQREIYAREQLMLHQRQNTQIVTQAIRIGEIAIATTPNETYALTGLKLKLQSPLAKTMVIELANGGDGYIPPPEQHLLGGYNTWAARSAGLEVTAEPKIVAADLKLLERVSGKSRRHYVQSRGPAAQALLAQKPRAYWRLDEFTGPRTADSTAHHCDAVYEPAILYFLEGPRSAAFCTSGETNRCVHLAGDRLRAQIPELGNDYSVSLWIWNGMPADGRETTGWMLSRDYDGAVGPHGEHLGLGGTATEPGKLVYLHGDPATAKPIVGRTAIERWTWNHVVFVRQGDSVRVYLNGDSKPEIETKATAEFPEHFEQLFLGGRSDRDATWEGRLDEIAVFDRALSGEEVAKLAKSAAEK